VNEYLFQEEVYRIPVAVTVVLSRPWHKILDDEKALLAKILGSVRLSLDAVQIQFQPQISLQAVQKLNSGKVLLFGPAVEGVSDYQPLNVDGTVIIRADDLGQLDDLRKKNLWLGLKQMFGL
jgi:hypothetical protein